MLNSHKEPLISFVVPHYNLPEELLQRCIASILAQKLPKECYEIIVVDDGSDTAPALTREQADEDNIKLIFTDHSGPGGARNAGIDAAQGKYIQFIDADDTLCPESLGECVEILRNERPSILRFAYNVCYEGEVSGNQAAEKKPVKCSNTISGAAFMAEYNLHGSPWSYIFERKIADINNIRFATGVYHEDEEFNTKLHYHAPTLVHCDITVYNYCIRKGSITANSNSVFEEKRLEDLFSLLERLCEFRKSETAGANPLQRRGIERKMAMLTVDTLLNLFYANKSAKEIIKLCNKRLRALSLYPLPKKNYSLKYRIFRKFSNNKAGLFILRMIIPRHKPKKR